MRKLSCGEARDMACELIDGELADEERTNLEAHVAACPTCPNLYRALVAVTTELARLQDTWSDGV